MPTHIELDKIRTDGGAQMRAELHAPTVAEYAALIDESAGAWPFPPVDLVHDGAAYWLADGFHRVAAARLSNKLATVPAIVNPGTRRDAILHAASANANHGLRRSDADKRRAVQTLLADAEWAAWSDREIARRCLVSPTFVATVRSGVTVHVDSDPAQRTYRTKTGATATMHTANIGLRRSDAAAPERNPRLGNESDRLVRTKGFMFLGGTDGHFFYSPMPGAPKFGPYPDLNTCIEAAMQHERDMPPFLTEQEIAKIVADQIDEHGYSIPVIKNGAFKYGPFWDAVIQVAKTTGRPYLLSGIAHAMQIAAQRLEIPQSVSAPPAPPVPASPAVTVHVDSDQSLQRTINTPPAPTVYATISEIETVVRRWSSSELAGVSDPAARLRLLANERRTSADWPSLSVALRTLNWRVSDMRQAANNVASQIEQGHLQSPTAHPSPPPTPPADPPASPTPPADPPASPTRLDSLNRIRSTLVVARASLEEFAHITGKFTLILATKRDLSQIIDALNSELSAASPAEKSI